MINITKTLTLQSSTWLTDYNSEFTHGNTSKERSNLYDLISFEGVLLSYEDNFSFQFN